MLEEMRISKYEIEYIKFYFLNEINENILVCAVVIDIECFLSCAQTVLTDRLRYGMYFFDAKFATVWVCVFAKGNDKHASCGVLSMFCLYIYIYIYICIYHRE